MTVTADIREQVRQRAGFAGGFCGVTETDTGGELTIDHFQPRANAPVDSISGFSSTTRPAPRTVIPIRLFRADVFVPDFRPGDDVGAEHLNTLL
jgi:hypothetical protein